MIDCNSILYSEDSSSSSRVDYNSSNSSSRLAHSKAPLYITCVEHCEETVIILAGVK